jgi:hypothetical protein
MNNKTKAIISVALVVIIGAGAYVGYNYYMLVKAYNTSLTPEEASTLLDTATMGVSEDDIIPDNVTANADKTKGTTAE